MLLKSLILKNIRSYNNLEIQFPKGSTLLSGDIGTGKTTILIAIEFALFGLLRGSISGSTLLRHGKPSGSVALSFEVDKKEIEVMRSLKRIAATIVQDAGYISINGVKTDATAIEIKSKILELLGYPDDLLSKSKSLIYRYTVYTPQEEMKYILFEHHEERLQKLRLIFDIDKYKRIKENASNYAKDLRSEIKTNILLISDLDQLKNNLKQKQVEEKTKFEEQKKINENLNFLRNEEEKAQKILEETQNKIKEFSDEKNRYQLLQVQIKSKNETKKYYESEIKTIDIDLSKEIKEEQFIEEKSLEKISEELKIIKDKQSDVLNKINIAKQQLAVIDSKKEDSKKLVDSINILTKCPTCLQEVNETHKKHLQEAEEKKLNQFNIKEVYTKEYLEKAEKILEKYDEEIELKLKEKQNMQIVELRKKDFLEDKKRLEKLKERKELLVKKVVELNNEIIKLEETSKIIEQKIKNTKNLDDSLQKNKDSLRQATLVHKNAQIKKAQIDEQIKSLTKEKEFLEKDIDKKEKIKSQIQKSRKTENWISNHFINVVDTIEKHVLASIHQEFNENFKEWFNTLMDDESINAGLDSSFNPILQQNGYDTEIQNLSGGEKTSVALAYRLALNKVINNFIGTIKTRDFIILDEPTDGFSSYQLDKVRDVLEQLNCNQTIIVSHEPKMESFVENIIRINKHEHISQVL